MDSFSQRRQWHPDQSVFIVKSDKEVAVADLEVGDDQPASARIRKHDIPGIVIPGSATSDEHQRMIGVVRQEDVGIGADGPLKHRTYRVNPVVFFHLDGRWIAHLGGTEAGIVGHRLAHHLQAG